MASNMIAPGVSRETSDRIGKFVDLLLKWNGRINLIGTATADQVWQRHVLDSLQICDLAPKVPEKWVDLGSGGGFPGIIAAIFLAERGSMSAVHLVESDQRKAAFLREAARQLGLNVTVHARRIEDLAPLGADVLSARALTALPGLCSFADRHLAPAGICLFPKGASWQQEVGDAKKSWVFDLETRPSVTSPESMILMLRNIAKAGG